MVVSLSRCDEKAERGMKYNGKVKLWIYYMQGTVGRYACGLENVEVLDQLISTKRKLGIWTYEKVLD